MKKQLRKIRGAVLYLLLVVGVIAVVELFVPQSVIVGVIDTGISHHAVPYDHILVGGNYVNPTKSTDDTDGHGTAMASLIYAAAPDVQMVPLVSNAYADGSFAQVDSATLAQMIVDAVDQYDCQIIHLGTGLGEDDALVRDAVAYAEAQDVLVVAPAGNDYAAEGASVYYPAGYDSVLAVGSADKTGTEISGFSQRGDWVDLYACGEAVGVLDIDGQPSERDDTACSSAYVTGYAARLLGKEKRLSAQELRQRILADARSMAGGSKFLP